MKVIYGVNKVKKFIRPVVALGVFDGLHRGHLRILRAAVKQARLIKGISVVLTFCPHPQKEESICSLKHRLRLISQTGVNACIVIQFTPAFAQICAQDFVKDILAKKIGAKYVYIGKNFRFGRGARGNYALLKRLAKAYAFRIKAFNVIKINGLPVSSTYIRRLISKGNLKFARKFLSRPVTVMGTVIKGSALGRRLGFPTANINPHHEVLPPAGVYAVKIILASKKLNGLCYIGNKPTFLAVSSKHIEVYIFNFKKNIYAKDLEIQFVKKLRQEKKFNSAKALAAQIQKDAISAKKLLFLP